MIPFYLLMLQAAMPSGVSAAPLAESVVAAPAMPQAMFVLPQDTPVELMATVEVSTAKVNPGTKFKLRVNRAVEVDGRVLIPVGTPAFGEVITTTESGSLGKSGRLSARLLYIQLGEAQIPLEGDMNAKGTGAGSAGVAFVVSLFNPVTLFHRGNNAKIKAGEIIAGFVGKEMHLDLSGSRPRLAQQQMPQSPVTQPVP